MSRTYRNRRETFESYFRYRLKPDYFWLKYQWTDLEVSQRRAAYYSETCKWYTYSLPKDFRNSVNRSRRAKDRQSLYKAVNKEDDPQLFSAWNCKDSNSWAYW